MISSNSLGYVTLKPALAQVCIGQQFEVTCATNESNLVWSFVPLLINHQGVSIQQNWLIGSEDLTQQQRTIAVNSTSFIFVRTSMQHDLPLVSTMAVNNSSNELNMVNVSCIEVNDQFQRGMAAITTIIVVGDTHTGLMSMLY